MFSVLLKLAYLLFFFFLFLLGDGGDDDVVDDDVIDNAWVADFLACNGMRDATGSDRRLGFEWRSDIPNESVNDKVTMATKHPKMICFIFVFDSFQIIYNKMLSSVRMRDGDETPLVNGHCPLLCDNWLVCVSGWRV